MKPDKVLINTWPLVFAAAAILMITMGARQSLGLFVAPVKFGDFGWMWYADMVLARGAAFINLPIREAPLLRRLEPQGAV